MGGLPPGAGKQEWRSWARRVRSGVPFADLGAVVISHLDAWNLLRGTVLVYLALDDEFDLQPLITERVDVNWVATRTPEEGDLTVHALGGHTETHALGWNRVLGTSSKSRMSTTST